MIPLVLQTLVTCHDGLDIEQLTVFIFWVSFL